MRPEELRVHPVIAYPKAACCDRQYVLEVDLEPASDQTWGYLEEEYAVYCRISSDRYRVRVLGEPAAELADRRALLLQLR